jgi:hypothetical protein
MEVSTSVTAARQPNLHRRMPEIGRYFTLDGTCGVSELDSGLGLQFSFRVRRCNDIC